MMRGRPPSWNPFVGMLPGVWTEAIHVSSKDRMTLPAAVRGCLSWFGGVDSAGLLATLEPRGCAELSSWTVNGERAVADVSQRIEAAPPEERGDLAVAAMDRYMRIALEPPARLALPANLASHVEAVEGGVVRVVVNADRLWLWSERHWQMRRSDRVGLLTGSGD